MLQDAAFQVLRRDGHVPDALLVFHELVRVLPELVLHLPHSPWVVRDSLHVVFLQLIEQLRQIPFLIKGAPWSHGDPSLFAP